MKLIAAALEYVGPVLLLLLEGVTLALMIVLFVDYGPGARREARRNADGCGPATGGGADIALRPQ